MTTVGNGTGGMELFEDRAGDAVRFRVVGDFTFKDFERFGRCADLLREERIETAHLDLSAVGALQTAAVGLLLILGEEAQQRGVRMSMTPPGGEAGLLLRMARVDSVMPFDDTGPETAAPMI